MLQTEPEKKTGFLDRLPKIGRASQLFLIIVIFLVIFGVLWWINNQQPKTQADLNNTLSNLQKIVGVTETPKVKYEAELAQVTAETEAAKAVFPTTSQAPEILDTLLELAESNDISVTQTKVSTSTPTSTTAKAAAAAGIAIGSILTVELSFKGQVPKFQNFLLGLDGKLPTSQIKSLLFTTAVSETEEDTGKVTIDIYCYEDS
jgi:cytoskeletal protein RodZ